MERTIERSFSSFFLSSDSGRDQLRIGIMLDDVQLPNAWASIIKDIQSCDFARIELVIFDSDAVVRRTALARRTIRRKFRNSLSRRPFVLWAYSCLDERRVRLKNDPLSTEDCSKLLDGIDRVSVTAINEASSGGLSEETVERLRAAKLDVVVKFSFASLPDTVPDVAQHGIWALQYGVRAQGGTECLPELLEGEPVTNVTLQRLPSQSNPGLALARAVFATDTGSLAKNRARAYFGSTHLVVQKLRELHMRGWEHVEQRSEAGGPIVDHRGIARYPTNLEVIRWVAPLVARTAVSRVRRLVRVGDRIEHWRIAIRVDRDRTVVDAPDRMSGFRWIESPKGHYYADPFLLERGGRTWVFFEDFTYADNRGVIACAQVLDDGRMSDPKVVLASTGHLAYPCIFVESETEYMIPETSAERVVRLYRATRFPDVWERCAELYEGPFLDTSVWRQDDSWWFFTTLREPRGGAMMLMLFYADSLTGTWVSHPMNPISIDVHDVRGAGAIFRQDGRLMRPSQDCSGAYGYSFTLNEIVTLSTVDYAERRLLTVGPHWDAELVGTHTYSRVGSVEVIDGKVRRLRSDVN